MKILPTGLSKNEIKEIGEREQKRGVRLRLFNVGRDGLVQRGVSIYEVSKLLGHSDIRVTQIYAHLRPENLRNAVELLN